RKEKNIQGKRGDLLATDSLLGDLFGDLLGDTAAASPAATISSFRRLFLCFFCVSMWLRFSSSIASSSPPSFRGACCNAIRSTFLILSFRAFRSASSSSL